MVTSRISCHDESGRLCVVEEQEFTEPMEERESRPKGEVITKLEVEKVAFKSRVRGHGTQSDLSESETQT